MKYPSLVRGLAVVVYAMAIFALFQYERAGSGPRFPDSHAEVPCSDCHTLIARVGSDPADLANFSRRCVDCHGGKPDSPSSLGLAFHDTPDKTCIACHSFHDVERIRAGSRQFAFAFSNPVQRRQCLACHRNRNTIKSLSPGHREAVRIFHADFRFTGHLSSSETCLICHAEGGRVPDGLSFSRDSVRFTPRFDAHGSHSVGIKVTGGKGRPGNKIRGDIDPRLSLVDGRIECITCHSLASGQSFLLTAFETRDQLCRGCHEVG